MESAVLTPIFFYPPYLRKGSKQDDSGETVGFVNRVKKEDKNVPNQLKRESTIKEASRRSGTFVGVLTRLVW